MATVHSSTLRTLWGYHDLSGYFNEVSAEATKTLHDVSVFTSTAEEFAAGMSQGKVSFKGFLNNTSTTEGSEQTMAAAIDGSGQPISLCWNGHSSSGGRAWVVNGREENHKVPAKVNDMVMVEASVVADKGARPGFLLASLTSRGAGVQATTGVDFGATSTSSNGFVANQHTTVWNATTADWKIQQSTDSTNGTDGVWTDVSGGAFTQISAIGSQHLTTTTSVGRWVRAAYTLVGTASTTAVSFAKL